jgi:hypothetical protein
VDGESRNVVSDWLNSRSDPAHLILTQPITAGDDSDRIALQRVLRKYIYKDEAIAVGHLPLVRKSTALAGANPEF